MPATADRNRVTRRKRKSAPKATSPSLITEIEQVTQTIGRKQPVRQIHWGGGTPTYLSCERLTRIHEAIAEHFALRDDVEIAIELDPRVTTTETIKALRQLGFSARLLRRAGFQS